MASPSRQISTNTARECGVGCAACCLLVRSICFLFDFHLFRIFKADEIERLRARHIEREEELERLRIRIQELESPADKDEPILIDLAESAVESEAEAPPIVVAAAPAIVAPVVVNAVR